MDFFKRRQEKPEITQEIKLLDTALETMAFGKFEERTICPVCGSEKDSRHWVCSNENCLTLKGLVQKKVKEIRYFIEPELFAKIVTAANAALTKYPNTDSKTLAIALRKAANLTGKKRLEPFLAAVYQAKCEKVTAVVSPFFV